MIFSRCEINKRKLSLIVIRICNVCNLEGRICLDVLKEKWSPALQIRTVLLSIQALLSAPNPDDPLANDVAEQWKTNEGQAIETAKAWTRLYAKNT